MMTLFLLMKSESNFLTQLQDRAGCMAGIGSGCTACFNVLQSNIIEWKEKRAVISVGYTYGIAALWLALNVVSFAAYGIDKYKAVHHRWRIPEATLIGFAVVGVIGALAGMKVFRHKTRKNKFRIGVPVIFVLEGVVLGALYVFFR